MFKNLWPFKKYKGVTSVGETQGVASIEFAFIAPVFFLLFLGIFEVGAILLVQQSLETAVLQASRFGRTGDVVAGETVEETAASLASTYSFGLADPAKLVLTVTPYASLSDVPTLADAPDDGTQNFGTSSQVALYTLSYKWDLFSVLVGNAMGFSNINLKASTVVQNEPY